MALWHQIRRSGIQRLVLHSQNPTFLHGPVRFFAVPAHVKAMQTAEPSGPRINGAITAAYVRLVTDEGHGVISMREALDRAKQLNLDLVEVQRTANPPVCKLMDFHKEKFKQEVKEKDRAKSKSTPTLRNGENKEVRFTAKTELKDLKIKSDTITRLMERGYRVKCTALPSGKEEEDLRGLLARILALIEDVAIVESGPHVVDSKQAYIIVRHVMFATKKSGKKAIKPLDALNRVQSAVTNEPEAVKSSIQEKVPLHSDEWKSSECGSDAEINVQVDHTIQQPRFKVTNDREEGFVFDAKRNTVEDNHIFKPSQHKPSVQSESEPSVVEVNRYAKQSEPKNFHQNREKMPQQATRNGSDPRAQFDPRQRQFNNTTNSSSPSSGHGRFNATKPPAFDQRNLGAVGDKPRHPGPAPDYGVPHFNAAKPPAFDQRNLGAIGDKPRHPGPAPDYGVHRFNPTKPPAFDQRNLGAVGDKARHPGPAPGYGVPRSSKTAPSSDQRNSGEATVDQTRSPSFFSSTKPVGSGGQSSTNYSVDRTSNTGNPSAPSQSYGGFSAMKPGGPDHQKMSKDGTPEKDTNSSAAKSYGIFSKPKAGSPGV